MRLEGTRIRTDGLTRVQQRLLATLLPLGEPKDREALRLAFGWTGNSLRVALSNLRSRGRQLGFSIDGRDALTLRATERVAWKGCPGQDCGTCRSCVTRTKWRTGVLTPGAAWTKRQDRWTEAEVARLRELAGTRDRDAIAAVLVREFGTPRTGERVRAKALHLGISLALRDALRASEVARIFGVDPRATVVGRWIASGALVATRGRVGGHWRIREADLERFLRCQVWEYTWQRMAPGRWRQLAEVVNRSDPWIPLSDAARAIGYARITLIRFRRAGLVEARLRRGHGHGGQTLVVRRADLPRLSDRLAARARCRQARVVAGAS